MSRASASVDSGSTRRRKLAGPHSVPFIVPENDSEDARFIVTREAQEVLGRIRCPIAPIAVAGKYRTGKSFLLNKLLHGLHIDAESHGFEVGPTVEACTKGIWLWSEPLYLPLPESLGGTGDGSDGGGQYAVLFIDTEGMGAAGATAEHDSRIFSLATLLCSVLLYNSVGAIDEEAIQSLAFIANLTRHIQVKSGSGAGESAVIDGAALEDAASEESGSDPDSDEEEDDDEEDGAGADSDDDSPLRAKGKSGKGKGKGGAAGGAGGDNYIAELRRAARKKRAAAKRAQALRLREEARRAAGVSRKGALLTAASSAVLGSSSAALDGNAGENSPLDLGLSGGSAATAAAFPVDKKKGGGNKGGKASSSSSAAIAGAGIDEREVSAFFPTFLWLLRDFSLDLRDDDGSVLSPREYLEGCLQPQEGFSSDVQARNRTRRVLTAFFKERECFTLVRPLDDESLLQTMDSLPETSLRPMFRRQMSDLCSVLVADLARPKTMQGQFVTGRMLAGLAEAYCAAINAHAVPSIGNAWEGVAKVECTDALETSLRAYSSGMEVEAPRAGLPKDEKTLEVCHAKMRLKALEAFDNKAVGKNADKYRQRLKEQVDREWSALLAANVTASEAACQRIITRLWATVVEPRLLATPSSSSSSSSSSLSSSSSAQTHTQAPTTTSSTSSSSSSVYSDHAEFEADFNRVQEQYLKEAAGPAVHKVLSAFVFKTMPLLVRALNRARAAELELATAALTASVANLKSQLGVATAAAAAAEASAAALRQERAASAVDKAKAEAEAKRCREEKEDAEEQLQEKAKELDEVKAKLQQERTAHAQTRVALKAAAASGGVGGAGSGGKGVYSSGNSGAGAMGNGHLSPTAVAALAALASPSSAHARAGSVDMRAIVGASSSNGGTAAGGDRRSKRGSSSTAGGGKGKKGGSGSAYRDDAAATGGDDSGSALGPGADHMAPKGNDLGDFIARPPINEIKEFPLATGSSGPGCGPGGGCVLQ